MTLTGVVADSLYASWWVMYFGFDLLLRDDRDDTMVEHVCKLVHIFGMSPRFELPFLLLLLTSKSILAIVYQNTWIRGKGIFGH